MKSKTDILKHLFCAFLLRSFSVFALCACLLAGCSSPESVSDKYRLSFDANGKFKIVQFTDLHLTYGTPTLRKTIETVKLVLAAEKPDVVVITGDIVWKLTNREPWTELMGVFEEAKTPFAVAFGNHDAEGNTEITRSEIMDILLRSPYFIGEKGPEDIHGVGNYVVPVYGRNNKAAALLYCFDSHSYSTNPKASGYEPIHFDQVAWYRQKSDELTAANDGKPLPALAFFHVPLPEYSLVAMQRDVDGARSRGGSYNAPLNTGLFASFFEKEDVMGVFVGHIHGNDYIGIEKYIALGYGRVTGWEAGAWQERGARVIELYEGEFVFNTWIRTAKGVEQMFYYPTGISSMDEETMTYLPAKNVSPDKQGVAYTYYEGRFGSVKNIDPAKKAGEGVMKTISITEAPAKDFFAYEFRSFIKIPERGVYKFYTISDDDSQVYIDDQLILEKSTAPIARVDGKVALEAGFHELKVLFYEDYGVEFLEVGYSGKTFRDRKLSEEKLYVAK
jgi:hypothetical protein